MSLPLVNDGKSDSLSLDRPEHKVAIVTGAASGIGRSTVEFFVASGVKVVAVDRDLPDLGDVRIVGDITDEKTNREMTEAAKTEFGGLDTVVLNAGIAVYGALQDMDLADFDRVMNVNVRAVALGIRAATPVLSERGGGSIVVTASIAGFGGGATAWPYATSKAAVMSLVRGCAIDLAPYGIRVNAVCPGVIHTNMVVGITRDAPELSERMRSNVPMGRFGEVAEIAEVISFLASPAASYITGVALPIDGGVTAAGALYAPFS